MPKNVHPAPSQPNASDHAVQQALFALQMQRPDEAERIAAEVLKANRGHLGAATVLARALMMQNRPDEAIAPLEKAARRANDPGIETELAAALVAAGRHDDALKQLRQTTARRPVFPPAFFEYANQLSAQGKYRDAVDLLESGRAVAPHVVEFYREIAFHSLKLNARTRARECLTQALDMAPDRADLLAGLAQVMLLDGDYAAAAETYRRSLALQPNNEMARILLSSSLFELNERDAAEANLREIVREMPQMTGRAITALADAPHGRLFLRPSDAEKFLRR